MPEAPRPENSTTRSTSEVTGSRLPAPNPGLRGAATTTAVWSWTSNSGDQGGLTSWVSTAGQ